MKLTKKKAKELSIKKWEYIVKNKGCKEGLLDAIPELKKMDNDCGYCEWKNETKRLEECDECPLFIKNIGGCSDFKHPYWNWVGVKSKENAQAVLDLIRKS